MRKSTRGVWCGTRNVNTVRILAAAGFDWLVLDAQHGDIDRAGAVAMTVEPAGGSETPTLPVLAAAEI